MQRMLQYTHTGYSKICNDSVVTPPTGKVVHLYKAKVMNGTAGAISIGICKKLATTAYIYSWTEADTPKAAVLSGTASIITTTTDDGFVVQAKEKFNVFGLTLTQASTGSPVYAPYYWNGSAFTALTTIQVEAFSATGFKTVAFLAPNDWVVGGPTGTDSTMYSIQIIASTAPSQAVKATVASLMIAKFIDFGSNVAAYGSLEFTEYDFPIIMSGNESMLPYFSSASANNTMSVVYSIQG